jgi:hypothetical protein
MKSLITIEIQKLATDHYVALIPGTKMRSDGHLDVARALGGLGRILEGTAPKQWPLKPTQQDWQIARRIIDEIEAAAENTNAAG